MSAVRAGLVRERAASLARTPTDVDIFASTLCELLGRAVPFDYACLATTDPATGLITGATKTTPGDSGDAEFARYEYEVDDVNQFAEIALRPIPVGVLGLDTDGCPETSPRYRDFLVPQFSHGHELRVAFRTGATVWGVLGLYRSTGPSGFTATDAELIGSLSETVALGLRHSLITTTLEQASAAEPGPAVIVVGSDDQVQQITPSARQRIEELGGIQWGALPMPLLAITAAARAARTGRAILPRVRLRTATGQWIVAHAAPLSGSRPGTGEVVMTLEPAGPPEIVPLVVAAFGLTNREQDVVRLVLQGISTTDIGTQLHLSPYTVQDHLKSVFAKAGVNSRRALTARIFFDHYAPRLGSPRGPQGWFLP